MARFRVVSPSIEFHTGSIGLSPQQVVARRHNLKSLGSGRYEILQPITFKLGEEIEVEGPLSKALLARVEPVGHSRQTVAPKQPAAPAAKNQPRPTPQQLARMNKTQLVALGKKLGLGQAESMNKADLAAAVKKKLGA
ncbi:hypothetical protein LCGC14_1627370 [marine sediment metagenome]|uniref:Uncharacterized protein n=1 Tax=marine sediment metagenome TaxID=412755 RepID=A0A0F9I3Z3_9ZZZZ